MSDGSELGSSSAGGPRRAGEPPASYYDEVVAVVGSREHPDLDMVRAYVHSLPRPHIIVSGGAAGVDRAAQAAAYEWMVYRPGDEGPRIENSWGVPAAVFALNQYALAPRHQTLFRNTFIAAQCKRMVVFPDGSKGGCWDAARQARRFGKPVEVRWCDGRVEAFTK